MRKTARVVIAILLTPFVPWAVYWLVFAGINAADIVAEEGISLFVIPGLFWAFCFLSAVLASVFALFLHVRKPKDLL